MTVLVGLEKKMQISEISQTQGGLEMTGFNTVGVHLLLRALEIFMSGFPSSVENLTDFDYLPGKASLRAPESNLCCVLGVSGMNHWCPRHKEPSLWHAGRYDMAPVVSGHASWVFQISYSNN